jgi:hypothetical protein
LPPAASPLLGPEERQALPIFEEPPLQASQGLWLPGPQDALVAQEAAVAAAVFPGAAWQYRQAWRSWRDQSSASLPWKPLSLWNQSWISQKSASAPVPLHPPQASLSVSSSR